MFKLFEQVDPRNWKKYRGQIVAAIAFATFLYAAVLYSPWRWLSLGLIASFDALRIAYALWAASSKPKYGLLLLGAMAVRMFFLAGGSLILPLMARDTAPLPQNMKAGGKFFLVSTMALIGLVLLLRLFDFSRKKPLRAFDIRGLLFISLSILALYVYALILSVSKYGFGDVPLHVYLLTILKGVAKPAALRGIFWKFIDVEFFTSLIGWIFQKFSGRQIDKEAPGELQIFPASPFVNIFFLLLFWMPSLPEYLVVPSLSSLIK